MASSFLFAPPLALRILGNDPNRLRSQQFEPREHGKVPAGPSSFRGPIPRQLLFL
jgi:hypothetical protein